MDAQVSRRTTVGSGQPETQHADGIRHAKSFGISLASINGAEEIDRSECREGLDRVIMRAIAGPTQQLLRVLALAADSSVLVGNQHDAIDKRIDGDNVYNLTRNVIYAGRKSMILS